MIRRIHLSGHHKEALRTNLWLVPAIEVLAALGLFAASNVADRGAYHCSFMLRIQASEESVPDEPDRADVRRQYQAFPAVHAQLTGPSLRTPGS